MMVGIMRHLFTPGNLYYYYSGVKVIRHRNNRLNIVVGIPSLYAVFESSVTSILAT